MKTTCLLLVIVRVTRRALPRTGDNVFQNGMRRIGGGQCFVPFSDGHTIVQCACAKPVSMQGCSSAHGGLVNRKPRKETLEKRRGTCFDPQARRDSTFQKGGCWTTQRKLECTQGMDRLPQSMQCKVWANFCCMGWACRVGMRVWCGEDMCGRPEVLGASPVLMFTWTYSGAGRACLCGVWTKNARTRFTDRRVEGGSIWVGCGVTRRRVCADCRWQWGAVAIGVGERSGGNPEQIACEHCTPQRPT